MKMKMKIKKNIEWTFEMQREDVIGPKATAAVHGSTGSTLTTSGATHAGATSCDHPFHVSYLSLSQLSHSLGFSLQSYLRRTISTNWVSRLVIPHWDRDLP